MSDQRFEMHYEGLKWWRLTDTKTNIEYDIIKPGGTIWKASLKDDHDNIILEENKLRKCLISLIRTITTSNPAE